jgi:Tfp pilus assembly protein PilX
MHRPTIVATPRAPRSSAIARQRGATSLFVTLIVLLVVMILGVTAALLSGSLFKLASNLQFENVAFNLAEGAAATAQNWLTTGTNFNDSGFTTGTKAALYPIGSGPDPVVELPAGGESADSPMQSKWWTDAKSAAIGDGSGNERYLIQKIATNQVPLGESVSGGGRASTACEKADLFRVTARGTATKNTSKFVQTAYAVPNCE